MLRPAMPSVSSHMSDGSTSGCAGHRLLTQRSVGVVSIAYLVDLLWIATVLFNRLVCLEVDCRFVFLVILCVVDILALFE